MAKKEVVKDVSEFTVEMADNGFIVRYNGRDMDDDWADAKRIVPDMNGLIGVIQKLVQDMQ
jgi:hypothetical protein